LKKEYLMAVRLLAACCCTAHCGAAAGGRAAGLHCRRRQRRALGLTRLRVRPIPRFAEPGGAGESFPCAFLTASAATLYDYFHLYPLLCAVISENKGRKE